MMALLSGRTAVAALVAAALTLAGCSHPRSMAASDTPGRAGDHRLRVAVATAYGPELDALLPELKGTRERAVNGVTYYTGQLAGQDVVLFKTGVSIVNATMNTQVLLDHFNITEIIVSGIAGGVDPNLSIGDVTVPARWGKYDEWIFMREVAPDDYVAPSWFGEPEHASFGYMRPQGNVIAREGAPNPDRQFWWPVDEGMLVTAGQAAKTVRFERCSPDGQCLDATPHVDVGGNGVSGSIFMDNADVRAYLHETFAAQVVEMETAAIGMVAHANGVPYVAFRSLSDLAGGGHADANEIDAFQQIAAQNSAAFVLEYLRVRGASADVELASAPSAEQSGCEINYSTMPEYAGKRLGETRMAKLEALRADPVAEQAFVTSFDTLTNRTVALVSDLEPRADVDISDVWGGYRGNIHPSLAGRLAGSDEERGDAARIGAALGYVFLQESVPVHCAGDQGDPDVAPSFALTEAPGADALNTASLPSLYSMMSGEADGETTLGFTYYPEEDRFSTLGLTDGGEGERAAIDAMLKDLEALTPGREPKLSTHARWVAFPANDWNTQLKGDGYVEAAGLAVVRAELDAIQAEFIAAIDALPSN